MNESLIARLLLDDKDALDFAAKGEVLSIEVKKVPIERQTIGGLTVVEDQSRALLQIACDFPSFKLYQGIKRVLIIGID
jgi:hypothetical protein